MPRGAKPGENRFKSTQRALTTFRLNRLKDIVVPKLKALATHTSISSINKFCSLAANIYNDDLPLNEQPISYRRLNQSKQYWEIVGPIYHKHFDKKQNLEKFKSTFSTVLSAQRIAELESQLERMQAENKTLRLTLTNTPSEENHLNTYDTERLQHDIENMGRIIEILIVKYGVVEVDLKNGLLRDLADDLEKEDGMLPKATTKSYIQWLKNKKTKLSGTE